MSSLLAKMLSRLRTAFRLNPALTTLGAVMAVAFGATLIGIAVDDRIITGMPAWVKPAKFAISTSIYAFTFVWLLSFVEGRPRFVRIVGNVTALSLLVEMVIIFGQAARGITSHFNISTALDAALWSAMGGFIVLVWLMTFALAIVLLRQRMTDRVLAGSVRLGLVVSLVGMSVAFLMTSRPTAAQKAVIASGERPRTFGAHSVGVEDGGRGLPFVGWSTEGGDLRVAHFVGLHGLQVLPFLGWVLTRRRNIARFSERSRLGLIWTAGAGCLGVVLLLTWQALRGQSVVRPDAATIAAFAALTLLVAMSALISVAPALRVPRATGLTAAE